MVDTLEVKRKYTCDCCHCTHISTDGFPFGWISINGYEPDNNRPDPTIQLCSTCAMRAYRQITADKVLSALIERLKDESCIFYSNTMEQLQALKPAEAELQKDTTIDYEDTEPMYLRVFKKYYSNKESD